MSNLVRGRLAGALVPFALLFVACAAEQPPPKGVPAPTAAPAPTGALALPPQLAGKAVLLPAGDPDAARADLASAVKAAGGGGITQGIVIRVIADVPVWRLWNGPDVKDKNGYTNRMGQWWSYDPPHGMRYGYRAAYEICDAWNDLTWVAKCTLKAGAVVAIGPGNSVSPETCGDPTGHETYAVNTRDWQVWVSNAPNRPQELECPPVTSDYREDPTSIARPRPAPPGK